MIHRLKQYMALLAALGFVAAWFLILGFWQYLIRKSIENGAYREVEG